MNDPTRPRSLAERLRSLLLSCKPTTLPRGWKPQDAQRVVRMREIGKEVGK